MLHQVSKSKIKFLCYASVYLGWGTTYLAIRVGLDSFGPASFLAIRFLSAAFLFLPFILKDYFFKASGFSFRVRDLGRAMAQGIGLLFFGLFPVALAEREIPSNLTALVIGGAPIGFALFDHLLNKKILTVRQIVSICMGILGILILNFHEENMTRASALSVGLLVFGVLCWCFSSIYFKRKTLALPVAWNVFFQYLGAGACLAIYAVFIEHFKFPVLLHASRSALIALLYITLIPSIISYGAYIWLLGNEPSERVSTYAFVNPVVAMIAGAWVLGEAVTPVALFALMIILTGTYLIFKKPSAKKIKTLIANKELNKELCSE